VRRIHDHIRGVDAVTGRPYAARDPALLLWVHAAQVDSVLAAGNLIGTAPSAADSDRYVAEMVTAAELVGVPRPLVPASVAELERYVGSVRPGLSCTSAAAESMVYLLDPPGLDEEVAEIWQDVRDAAIAVLPEWARQMYNYDAPSLSPGRRTEIRQSLGVVDAMFRSQPDALLLPGGAVNAGRLRTEPAVQSFIQQINGAGKPMAVICHAPRGLVPAGLARGRTLTSYHTLQDDLRNACATWADREVVVHGNLVTSRQPSDIPAFTREMLDLFAAARGA
jgi:putative intracellular protease/amidase